jgi:hypothetical protein
MNRELIPYAAVGLLATLASALVQPLYAQEKTAETITFCQLISRLDEYRETELTLRVTVKTYRHGTTISDRACPKQSLLLVADEAGVQTDALSHFYKFLAEHRHLSKQIVATITGRIVKGEDRGFAVERDLVFKLESASDISEGG